MFWYTIVKNGKQPKSARVGEGTSNMLYVHTAHYCSVITELLICYNMDGFKNKYVEWKKVNKKEGTYCLVPYIWNSRLYKLSYSDKKPIQWSPRAPSGCVEGQEKGLYKGTRKLLGETDMFTILILMMISWVYMYVKIY